MTETQFEESAVSPQVLKDAKRATEAIRKTGFFTPLKIILFGSRARGEAGPNSDTDLAVVIDGTADEETLVALRDETRKKLQKNGVKINGQEIDPVIINKRDLERRSPDLNDEIIQDIKRDGVIIWKE